MDSPRNDIKDLMLDAIDRGLSEVFESIVTDSCRHPSHAMSGIKQVIYLYIDRKYSLPKERILEDPERFQAALRDLLGPGAPIIERAIPRNICSTFGLEPKDAMNIDFTEYVRAVIDRFEVRPRKRILAEFLGRWVQR